MDVSGLEHFLEVHIPVAPEWGRVDVLIEQSDKTLLTVRKEHEGVNPEKPNHVFTHLGPMASGWRACGNSCLSGSLSALKVNDSSSVEADYNRLKEKNKQFYMSMNYLMRLFNLQKPMNLQWNFLNLT